MLLGRKCINQQYAAECITKAAAFKFQIQILIVG